MTLISSRSVFENSEYVRISIVEEARKLLGTRWKHMGRTENGIDCVGLIITVGRRLGLHDYPDDVTYTRQSMGHDLIQPFVRHGERVPNLIGLKDGDILIMKDMLFPHHTGFLASTGDTKTIIHACVFRGAVVEDTMVEDDWKKVITAFRFKGLD
jgi:hypothetical protein